MKVTSDEYIFGANILENLTTGMYKDSRVIYREYIQNACDSIDKAVECGLLASKKEGQIQIWMPKDKTEPRNISIEDNAMGIPSSNFKEVLANIADSDKEIGKDKGFRGIGRLCGLAYCKELVFTSKAKGENVISIMRCDAQKMREMILKSENGAKFTASEVLHNIYTFEERAVKEIDDHWFKVELIGINEENTDLMDFALIKDYLSFVAPVPYVNKFIYRNEIRKHAQELGYPIDEYGIKLRGEDIFKQYSTFLKTRNGDDEIYDIKFKEIYDENSQLIAWLWFGLSHQKATIKKECKMRSLRLRKENIQIGDEDALQKLFNEDRGQNYYIGEVFAVSKDLIPNSQRDYFNENPMRVAFEDAISKYFNGVLKKIYYESSKLNNAYKAIDDYAQKAADHEKKVKDGEYVDRTHRDRAEEKVEDAFKKAKEAEKEIERKKRLPDGEAETIVKQMTERIERERKESGKKSISEQIKVPTAVIDAPTKKEKNVPHRTDKLSRCSSKDRKLIGTIYGIILNTVDEQTAELIIQKIEEEFK